jgi:hypothetical protein
MDGTTFSHVPGTSRPNQPRVPCLLLGTTSIGIAIT